MLEHPGACGGDVDEFIGSGIAEVPVPTKFRFITHIHRMAFDGGIWDALF